MKLKSAYIAAAALLFCTLCTGGCNVNDSDTFVLEGPRTISAEAQTVVYVPREDTTPDITGVSCWLVEDGSEKISGYEYREAADLDLLEFDFFSVAVVGQNIVLDIDENTTGCYREITVQFQCEGYDPNSLTVTQLPAGADEVE